MATKIVLQSINRKMKTNMNSPGTEPKYDEWWWGVKRKGNFLL
jgi:hypothetical protein